ncbi:hypothetical protein [Oceanobacillus senegalensis]|uniref:hypothetical protein n=1 Tax=Oceanobacillus senegalensis TaxID=1936063 RepID=UPI000A31062F|nr:hypothetical protein [Oceanobacillus senegalensis]
MKERFSISVFKNLIEKKMKKKILVKVMWNDNEKITLFITPNMKINSFINDDKEGYFFYDNEGKLVEYTIPCILAEENLVNGQVVLEGVNGRKMKVNNQLLSKEDIQFLKQQSN